MATDLFLNIENFFQLLRIHNNEEFQRLFWVQEL